MTYEDIVFAYNNRALDARTWDMISDRERVEFVLRMKGRQEPVAWSRLDTAKSVITENEDIKRGWDLDGLPFKCLFDSPQPCPECDEKQSAIDVWEGRYADKTAECEKLKAERDDALRYKKYWTEWVSLQSGDLRKLPERAEHSEGVGTGVPLNPCQRSRPVVVSNPRALGSGI